MRTKEIRYFKKSPYAIIGAAGTSLAVLVSAVFACGPAEYWTPERMAAAQPQPFPESPFTARAAHRADAGPEIQSRKVPQSSLHSTPYSNVGMLLFEGGGKDHACSASLIDDGPGAGTKYLLTAAHCVFDPSKQWNYNFHFCLRAHLNAHDKVACDKNIVATRVSIMKRSQRGTPVFTEMRGPDFPYYGYDIAVLKLKKKINSSGLRIAYDTPLPKTFLSIGYPGDEGFDGGDMYFYRGRAGAVSGANGLQSMQGNDLGHGASGGPWVYERPSGWEIVGVNSGATGPGKDPLVISPKLKQDHRGLVECALSEHGCQPGEGESGDGRLSEPVATYRQSANEVADSWAQYLEEGTFVTLHHRPDAAPCTGQRHGESGRADPDLELQLFTYEEGGNRDITPQDCTSAGIYRGSIAMALLKKRRVDPYLLLANSSDPGRSPSPAELRLYRKEQGTLVEADRKAAGYNKSVIPRQLDENHFALVMSEFGGDLTVDVWKVDLLTGKMSNLNRGRSLGPVSNFSVTRLAGNPRPTLLVSGIDSNKLILRVIEFDKEFKPSVIVDHRVKPVEGQPHDPAAIQMDNGVIVVGFNDENGFRLRALHLDRIHGKFRGPHGLIHYLAGRISLVNMGNDMLLVAVPVSPGMERGRILRLLVDDDGVIEIGDLATKDFNYRYGTLFPVRYQAGNDGVFGEVGRSANEEGFQLRIRTVSGSNAIRYETVDPEELRK